MSKLKTALVFGGVSSEHEVSCRSAATWARALDPDKYEVYYIGITKTGRWLRCLCIPDQMADGSWEQGETIPCFVSPDRQLGGLVQLEESGCTVLPLDLALPVLHGKNGEDGTIQGLFELAGIPYVGCGVLASAVCMDKAVANSLLDAAGIPRCAWDWEWADEAITGFDALAARLEKKLGWPIFVKPANAGSSVGVSKAADRDALRRAIEIAAAEDSKIVFERFVDGQEVECAVMGNRHPQASQPGEILASEEFYTYEDKYIKGTSRTRIPADLDPAVLERVRTTAVKAYRALGCEGLSRVDFFVEKNTGRVLLNEINTLPGFTAISMYPQMMAHSGLSLPQQLDRLAELALERAGKRHG